MSRCLLLLLALLVAPFGGGDARLSGIMTGTRQGALSSLDVRSAARGTPNCYTRAPLAFMHTG